MGKSKNLALEEQEKSVSKKTTNEVTNGVTKIKAVLLAPEFRDQIVALLGKVPAEQVDPIYTALKNAVVQEITFN